VEEAHKQPPLPSTGPATIPYTELPDAKPDSPLFEEWNYYRREVGRLLAEGQEGRFILIKGATIVGIWDTQGEAKAVAIQKYLMKPCLIHQIRSREPLVRMSARFWRCQGNHGKMQSDGANGLTQGDADDHSMHSYLRKRAFEAVDSAESR
jgi:hypothetical protein